MLARLTVIAAIVKRLNLTWLTGQDRQIVLVQALQMHTNGSNVLMSFNLLPLRFRCVSSGSFSARTSRPPLILLSLNSN